MNNKGFAITSFLYAILAIFTVIFSLLLMNIINTKLTLEKTKSNVKEEVEDTLIKVEHNISYNITYNLDGGINNGNVLKYNESILPLTLIAPIKTGYTFNGWTGSNGSLPQKVLTIHNMSQKNLEYTANWIKN